MSQTLNLSITLASAGDVAVLSVISAQTFIETYAHENTAENMQNYITEHFSATALASQLADAGTQFYLVQLDAKTVGYMKLNSGQAQTELKDQNAFELERIYVVKQQQGRGIGKLLAQKALQLATQRKAHYLWLGVWEKNVKAIGFYKTMGFTEFNRHIFKLGNDEQTDLMMKLETTEFNNI